MVPESYRGPERRDGTLSVGDRLHVLERRLSELDASMDRLTNRVTYLFGGIAAAAGLVALLDVYLRAQGR